MDFNSENDKNDAAFRAIESTQMFEETGNIVFAWEAFYYYRVAKLRTPKVIVDALYKISQSIVNLSQSSESPKKKQLNQITGDFSNYKLWKEKYAFYDRIEALLNASDGPLTKESKESIRNLIRALEAPDTDQSTIDFAEIETDDTIFGFKTLEEAYENIENSELENLNKNTETAKKGRKFEWLKASYHEVKKLKKSKWFALG